MQCPLGNVLELKARHVIVSQLMNFRILFHAAKDVGALIVCRMIHAHWASLGVRHSGRNVTRLQDTNEKREKLLRRKQVTSSTSSFSGIGDTCSVIASFSGLTEMAIKCYLCRAEKHHPQCRNFFISISRI